jgi:uncharacterized cupin superfamily protein
MPDDRPSPYLLRRADAEAASGTFTHPWNPRSEMRGAQLAKAVGLKRTGVNVITLPPGKESFAYHAHTLEEEWLYVLSGRAVAYVDGKQFEVGPGDFLGFPTPGVAHQLKNPFAEPVTYLSGGENHEVDVADFPDLGRRMVRRQGEVTIYDLSAGRPLGPEPE